MKTIPTGSNYCLSAMQIKRSLTRYLKRFDDCARKTQKSYLLDILNMLSFMERRSPHPKGFLIFSESVFLEWMRGLAVGRKAQRLVHQFLQVEHFMNALYEEGTLVLNPMAGILATFGAQGWVGIARALQLPDPTAALEALRRKPAFPGRFGQEALTYIQLHSASGKNYCIHRVALGEFSRVLHQQSLDIPAPIPASLVQEWIDSMTCAPRQRRRKVFVLRKFLRYLASTGTIASNPITDELMENVPRHKSSFTPYLFSPEQIRTILFAAQGLPPNLDYPLKPQMMYTLIALLYTLGLRIGEALSIRINDINFDQDTLFLAKTKFYKERLLPFGPKLRHCLKRYLEARQTVSPPLRPHDLLFVGRKGRPALADSIRRTFTDLIAQADVHVLPGKSKPRLHDLRHTFAVHRLLRWYKEKVDVQAHLPLLSTFMGHFQIYATQIYLTITDQLLEQANQRFHDRFGSSFHSPEARS